MITLEQVEKLCKRANISYDEAREVLEETNGDMLEAIINLERQGRIKAPRGSHYSSKTGEKDKESNSSEIGKEHKDEDYVYFRDIIGKFIGWCRKLIAKGNRNSFEISKAQKRVMTIPVTVMAILILFTFWVTVPILIIGLFCGYRYAFSGPDLGRQNVNRAMDSMADAAESIKKDVKGGNLDDEDSHN